MGKYVSLEWENKVKLQPYKFIVFVCLFGEGFISSKKAPLAKLWKR